MSAKKVWLASSKNEGEVMCRFSKSQPFRPLDAGEFFLELWFLSGGKSMDFEVVWDGRVPWNLVLEVNSLLVSRTAYPSLAKSGHRTFVSKLADEMAAREKSSVRVTPFSGFAVLGPDAWLSLYGPDLSGPYRPDAEDVVSNGGLLGITAEELVSMEKDAKSEPATQRFRSEFKSLQAKKYWESVSERPAKRLTLPNS